MGANKLLLPFEGRPLVASAIDSAFAGRLLREVVVVVGRDAEEIEGSIEVRPGLRFVVNPEYESGQASSLRVGLRNMGPRIEAAVVLLGDQPEVRADAVVAVARAYRDRPTAIVQASYSGRPAHPTLLARSAWPEAEALKRDVGARALIRSHPTWRTVVEVGGDPPQDVDTEDDYRRLLSRHSDR
jgi:CTP:molybdopterin cytidylyltransferase MocA